MSSKREALLSAAKDLLWEHGYEAMSPAKVLEASGAGQGSLYHHFKGKKDLALAALEQVSAEMQSEIRRLFDGTGRPLARVEEYLLSKRDGVKGSRLGRLALEYSILTDDELRQPIANYFSLVEEKIRNAVRDAAQLGLINPDLDADQVAVTLVAMIEGGFLLSRVHKNPAPMERAAQGALFMLRALATRDIPNWMKRTDAPAVTRRTPNA
ncbi:MAG: TetR/AcrR family transcriptional regulator [Rhodospirillales bacterium]|nr:TetR/AcrR family transcriptional regulator [Rhodospirillales bacterium]